MALVERKGGGAEGEVCVLRSPGIAASPISLLSMGGVCGRSLSAEKILFTGRQTCSLYLVLLWTLAMGPVLVEHMLLQGALHCSPVAAEVATKGPLPSVDPLMPHVI